MGLPAGIPIENRSYFPDDGSRRKHGWFWAHEWNTPQSGEMVRRLNEITGLPVASFQGETDGASFIVDGARGGEFAQKEIKPRDPAPSEPTLHDLAKVSANADLHVIGIYSPDMRDPGKSVDVEIRSTARPVVVVLTSYYPARWSLQPSPGARIKAVIVGSRAPRKWKASRLACSSIAFTRKLRLIFLNEATHRSNGKPSMPSHGTRSNIGAWWNASTT